MLYDLRRKAGKPLLLPLELPIAIRHLDPRMPPDRAHAIEGQTALLRQIRLRRARRDDRIQQQQIRLPRPHRDDALRDADHVGRHADAVRRMGLERSEQVIRRLPVFARRGQRRLPQQRRIPHDFPYHSLGQSSQFLSLCSGTRLRQPRLSGRSSFDLVEPLSQNLR